jgi:anti-sigma regulatory factor (Ser/Thr protein kinase)
MIVMNSQMGDTAAARRAAAAFVTRSCRWADPDAVVLIVSELVANATRHTTGWWQLRLEVSEDRLLIDVDDASHALPVLRTPDIPGEGLADSLDGLGGLGWPIVRTLATSVEVLLRPGGKTVRAIWLRSDPDATTTTGPTGSTVTRASRRANA